MEEYSSLLIAFGTSGAFIGWFLFQRTLSKMIEHIKVNHYEVWLSLKCPIGKSPPDPIIASPEILKFIFNKEYEAYTDLFLKEIGDVARLRLIFSVFCLICLFIGIAWFLIISL